MIAAGIDPATELQVFRGDTLALTIRNIGKAAKLTLRESGSDGRPRYIPAESRWVAKEASSRNGDPAGIKNQLGSGSKAYVNGALPWHSSA